MSGTDSDDDGYIRKDGTQDHGHDFETRIAALFLLRALRLSPEAEVAMNAEFADKMDDIVLILPDHEFPIIFLQLKHIKFDSQESVGCKKLKLKKYYDSFKKLYENEDIWKKRRFQDCRDKAKFVLYTNSNLKDKSPRVVEPNLIKFLNTRDPNGFCNVDPADHNDVFPEPSEYNALPKHFIIASSQANVYELDIILQQEISQQSGLISHSFRDIVKQFVDSIDTYNKKKGRVDFIKSNFPALEEIRKHILKYTRFPHGLCCSLSFIDEFNKTLEMAKGQVVTITIKHAYIQIRTCILAHVYRSRNENILLARAVDVDDDIEKKRTSVLSLWGKLYPYLLLDVGNYSKDSLNMERLKEYLKSSMQDTSRRLVLINSTDDSWPSTEISSMSIELPFIFSDLDNDSKNNVRNLEVKLGKDRSKSLGDVVSESFLHNLDGKTLSLLLQSNTLYFPQGKDDTLMCQMYCPEHYVPRKLVAQISVKYEVMDESKDHFLIESADEHKFPEEIRQKYFSQTYIDNEDGHNVFRSLCKTKGTQTVHWLQYRGRKLIWKATKESTKVLQSSVSSSYYEFLRKFKTATVEEDLLLQRDVSRIVLCADPGMGKTAFLARAANDARERFPDRCVIYWNLSDSCKEFSALLQDGKRIVSRSCIEEILIRVAGVEGIVSTMLADALWETGRVMLFIDAFDEIAPDYEEFVANALGILCNAPIKCLWVTTRAVTIKEVKDAMQAPILYLELLSTNQRDELIRKISHSFSEDNRSVIDNLNNRIKHQTQDGENLTRNPLYLRMLAECLHLDAITQNTIDIFVMYENFINRMFKRCFEIKQGINSTHPANKPQFSDFFNRFLKRHQICSLYTILTENELKKLVGNSNKFYNKLSEIIKEIQNKEEKTGFIKGATEGNIVFIHRTFAEYFAAQWMSELFMPEQLKSKAKRLKRKATSVFIREPHLHQVRKFFDYFVSKSLNLHRQILNETLTTDDFSLTELQDKDEAGRSPLHLASQQGNEKYLRKLLCKWMDNGVIQKEALIVVNCKDHLQNWSPIYYAAHANAWECVNFLVNCGANVLNNALDNEEVKEFLSLKELKKSNIKFPKAFEIHWPVLSFKNKNGLALIHIAVMIGNSKFVQTFLKMGVPINCFCTRHGSPLYYAVEYNQQEIVSLLLKANKSTYGRNYQQGGTKVINADVLAQGTTGWTCLHVAAFKGYVPIAKMLIDAGSHPMTVNKHLRNSIHFAAAHGSEEMMSLLLSHGGNHSNVDYLGQSPLHFAATKGKTGVAKLLLEKGSHMSLQDKFGKTPLHVSAHQGHVEFTQMLLENGADASLCDKQKCTPLHRATISCHVNIAADLLSNGSQVVAKNWLGDTPLHIAAGESQSELTRLLLNNGADILATNKMNATPLHIAAACGREENLKLIIERGKNKDVWKKRDKNRNTPFHVAIMYKKLEVLNLLYKEESQLTIKNNRHDTLFHIAADLGHVDIIKCLLEKSIDVLDHNKFGLTALHVAIEKGHAHVAELLMEKNKLIISIPDKKGSFPLHWATRLNHEDIVILLLRNGASVSVCDSEKNTPLHLAAEKRNKNLVRLLLKEKACISARNNSDLRPYDIASKYRYTEIKNLLHSKDT